jgi:hypothetical protein
MRIVVIKNNTNTVKQWIKEFSALEEWTVPDGSDALLKKYAIFDPLLVDIANGDASVGNGTEFFTSISQQINWLNGNPSTDANGVPTTTLASPSSLDGKPYVQSSPRPIKTFLYLSAQGDGTSTPSDIGGGQVIEFVHTQGEGTGEHTPIYFDLNSIVNETHLFGAFLQWSSCELDKAECEVCCKASPLYPGENTAYTVVSGILVQVPAGYGNIITPVWDDMLPVEMVPNDQNVTPAGYWDCTYNTMTKKFEDFVFKADGTGTYNIFSEEVEFSCFIPYFPMLNDGNFTVPQNNCTEIGHNMRIKIILTTRGTDHSWAFCATPFIYRKRTC